MDYFLLRRAFKQALLEQTIKVDSQPLVFNYKTLVSTNTQNKTPTKGTYWQFLSGQIDHVTGTESGVSCVFMVDKVYFAYVVPAATATGKVPVDLVGNTVIITSDDRLFFWGHANAKLTCRVIERVGPF